MLTINPSSLRSLPGDAGGNAASGGSTPSSLVDPAGFASLLRQNQIAACAMPAPAPVPPAVASPSPAPAPAASTESTPATDESSSTANSAPNGTEAPQEGDPANRARALLRGKLRAADNAAPTPHATSPSEDAVDTAKSDTKTDAASTDKRDATAAKAATSATMDPNVMQWLASLQRDAAAAGAKAGADGQASTDASAAATSDARDSAKGQRTADLKAEADAKDKATLGSDLQADAANAGRFAEVLVDQREIEKPALPQIGAAGGAKEAAAAASALASASTPAASGNAPAPTAVAIAAPVSAPEFAHELGLRLSLLANDGVQTAELHLNPADMGPVSVQIVMDGTQARVDFGADMAATRQAIEAGLPQLASALADAGFTLAGGGVSQHSGSGSGSASSGEPGASNGDGTRRALAQDPVNRVAAAARRIVTQGGIDLFA